MPEWYTQVAEQVVGPLSDEQLKALADAGRLAPNDPIAQSPQGPWTEASRVKGLFSPAPPAVEPPVAKPQQEPPVPQPPVVSPAPQAPPATPAAPPTPAPPTPAPPVASAPPAAAPPATGGIGIQTEQYAATERFQKKRVKKQREPLTKKQKNARLVKWLAVATVLGGVLLLSIPYLRNVTREVTKPKAPPPPAAPAADLDIGSTTPSMEDVFGSADVAEASPTGPAAASTDVLKTPAADSGADAVDGPESQKPGTTDNIQGDSEAIRIPGLTD
jgi:hypothetical protein